MNTPIIVGNKLLEEIEKGNIGIQPLDEKAIGTCSVDLRLSYGLPLYENLYKPNDVSEKSDYKKLTYPVNLQKNRIFVNVRSSSFRYNKRRN